MLTVTLILGMLLETSPAQAHPADMLFQSHVIKLTHINITWSIFPGYLLVPRIWAEIDSNADGQVSEDEALAWAEQRIQYLSVHVDSDVPIDLRVDSVDWPGSLAAFQIGQEVINISLSGHWPADLEGHHTFTLRKTGKSAPALKRAVNVQIDL